MAQSRGDPHALRSTAPPRPRLAAPVGDRIDREYGQIVCFLQPASKFKTTYATSGINDGANLDEGPMWPTSFALTKLSTADAKKIGAPVKRAVS